jgi:hypothetical protein
MERTIILILTISLTLSSCIGQTKKSEKQSKENLPKTSIKVNKEYDKNGNIIKYDSTYSSYYSNIKDNSNLKDSVMEEFKNHFNQSYFFSNQPFFRNFFFQDSLLMYDFYKRDFFYNRFRNNMERMDSLFRGMDLMKNDFFNKQVKPDNNKQNH